jgi:hypothetical protein
MEKVFDNLPASCLSLIYRTWQVIFEGAREAFGAMTHINQG